MQIWPESVLSIPNQLQYTSSVHIEFEEVKSCAERAGFMFPNSANLDGCRRYCDSDSDKSMRPHDQNIFLVQSSALITNHCYKDLESSLSNLSIQTLSETSHGKQTGSFLRICKTCKETYTYQEMTYS